MEEIQVADPDADFCFSAVNKLLLCIELEEKDIFEKKNFLYQPRLYHPLRLYTQPPPLLQLPTIQQRPISHVGAKLVEPLTEWCTIFNNSLKAVPLVLLPWPILLWVTPTGDMCKPPSTATIVSGIVLSQSVKSVCVLGQENIIRSPMSRVMGSIGGNDRNWLVLSNGEENMDTNDGQNSLVEIHSFWHEEMKSQINWQRWWDMVGTPLFVSQDEDRIWKFIFRSEVEVAQITSLDWFHFYTGELMRYRWGASKKEKKERCWFNRSPHDWWV